MQLQIVDILAENMDVIRELLIYSQNLAYIWKCNVVKLWLSSSEYNSVLSELGFTYGEHPFPMTVWNQDITLSKSYITMVDSDIF